MDQKLQHEPPPIKLPPVGAHKHEDALLDEAVAESMIASDPISPAAQALMDPVSATPSTPDVRSSSQGSFWIFAAGAGVALLLLLALRRPTHA